MAADISKITNSVTRAAIEALQRGDKAAWLALFADTVVFTDDGNERDFGAFTDSALGIEKFLSINTISDDGLSIHGDFDAGKWGTFPVFFKFHIDANNKISQLDIGQA